MTERQLNEQSCLLSMPNEQEDVEHKLTLLLQGIFSTHTTQLIFLTQCEILDTVFMKHSTSFLVETHVE